MASSTAASLQRERHAGAHVAAQWSSRTLSLCLGFLSSVICIGVTSAGIPEPPVVLYGQFVLDGQAVQGSDDATIIARVDGVPQPVGTYSMGQSPAAGDNYVLMLRVESPYGGLPPSDNAAQPGQTVNLFIKVSDGPDRPAGQITNLGSEPAAHLDLNVETTFGQCADEVVGIGLEDAAAFLDCMTGVDRSIRLECGCADVDEDGDSDMVDWANMQNAFNGGP